MNPCSKPAALLALSLMAVAAQASTSFVSVDSARTWLGYAAYFDLPSQGGNYRFAEFFEAARTAELPGGFAGNVATLAPNRRGAFVGDTGNPFFNDWWVSDGNGGFTTNKYVLNQFYVQDDSLAGSTVHFSGQVLANSLAPGYTAYAFIVETTGEFYALVAKTRRLLTSAGSFQLSADTTAGNHLAYGIEVWGPGAPDASLGSLGSVSISAVPEPSAMLLMALGVLALLARRRSR